LDSFKGEKLLEHETRPQLEFRYLENIMTLLEEKDLGS
jgi:hypothetical protein